MTKKEEVRIVFDLHFYSHADICENTIHIHITQLWQPHNFTKLICQLWLDLVCLDTCSLYEIY